VNERERYLFDVQGFLVVENVLSDGELETLNSHLDEYDLWENKGTGRFDELWSNDPNFVTVGPAHHWDAPFRRLLVHPPLLPYLTTLLGDTFRFDHGHALLMRSGGKHLGLHGGGTPVAPDSFYMYRDGLFHQGLLAVSFALTDANAGQGGFAAIPGSHKANLPCPKEFITFEETGPWMIHVPAKAGSAIIFSEALTHGTWPWTASHERRSLLYKYTPGHIAWAGDTPDARATRMRGEYSGDEYSERERQVLTPPSGTGRVPITAILTAD
jgi:hypothetical protein